MPHPGDMVPPLPPGEPPQLLSSKRTHGLATAGCTGPQGDGGGGGSTGSSAMDEETPRPAVSARGSSAPASSPAVCAEDDGDGLSDNEEMSAAPGRVAPAELPPGLPPGPPPAEMAPPPPTGPPPSLPLDRSELKRCPGEPAFPPLGKRPRHGGEHGDAAGCEEPAAVARPPSGGGAEAGTDLDTSYAQSSPSARWVWDRLLQQDGRSASAAAVERHMLSALDGLGFGERGAG